MVWKLFNISVKNVYQTTKGFLLLKFISILFLCLTMIGCSLGDPLTPEEREWLKKHDGKIIVNNEAGWAPIIDTDKDGNSYGIVMDYQKLLEKKLNFKFKMDKLDSWKNFMERFQNREIDVNNNLQKNPKRSQYALFTKPYIEIPNAIIVRNELNKPLVLEKMDGMKIAATRNFALHDFIKNKYEFLKIVPQNNDLACLLEVSTKNVDAAVVNLAVASFLIEKEGIANLRVAGYVNYTNKLCFASRKDWPILNRILEKGLGLITKKERDSIYREWISLERKYEPFYKNQLFWFVVAGVAGITLFTFFFILTWNRSLKIQVQLRTKNLETINIQLQNEITERKLAEEALKERSDFIDKIIQSSALSTWISDSKGTAIRANPACLKFFGATAEEVIGKYNLLQDVVIEQKGLMPTIEKVFEKAETANIIVDYDFASVDHVNVKNATHKIVNSILTPITDKHGKVTNVIVQAIDLTEIKTAELALKQSEEKHRALIENLSEMILILDKDGINLWNSPAVRQYGMEPEDAIGINALDYTHPDDKERVTKVLKDVVENPGKVITLEGLKAVLSDGRILYLDDTFVYLPETSGINGIVVTCHDVSERILTEQKQARLEEQLQQAQRMEAIGTLAGGIAHDFNNMLGVITGNTSFLLGKLNQGDELYHVLSDIQESSKQAQNLTHQLLTFSKGGAPIKKVTDINRLLKASVIFSTRGAAANCHFELSDELWSTEIDEGQINQVIGNLVINANQAMPNGGTITIRTENEKIEANSELPLSAGIYIKVIFKDQGVGISKKHLLNIFDPYFTTKQKGSGLGLATAYSIIKRHGGHISVYSEIEKGTVFNVYLPASLKGVSKVKDVVKPSHTGKGKILIMDDQEIILRMATSMLEYLGYDATVAMDGSQAIELFRDAYQSENPFNLVILDLTVPGGMGGTETIQTLLNIDPKLKAVVSSGYSNDPVMADYEAYGFCGLLPKPYTNDHMTTLLNKIFNEKER